MAMDHNHEQNNTVKESGGVIGLISNPGALRRWMVSGPEVARIVTEFENDAFKIPNNDNRHHEQHYGMQAAFHKEVKSL